MVNLNAVGSLKPKSQWARYKDMTRHARQCQGGYTVCTPGPVVTASQQLPPTSNNTPNQSGATESNHNSNRIVSDGACSMKGCDPLCSPVQFLFQSFMPTHGSWVHVIYTSRTSPPSYFILESPPRTQLLKWFSALAGYKTISDPGLFNNQSLL